MGKVDEYRQMLRQVGEWEPFLLEHSGLPGPRGNLELAAAVAEEADAATLRRWAAIGPSEAPFGSAEEFLPVCGVVGLGRLLTEGDAAVLADLRRLAADPRWRIREAVAIALQRYGDVDFDALLGEMRGWVAEPLSSGEPPSPPSANRGCSRIRRASGTCSPSSRA